MSKGRPPKNPETYEVGYCQPPKATRFKSGTSGNPKGRPKGKKTTPRSADTHAMMALFFAESERKVAVTENNTVKNISMGQAVIRSVAVKAAMGDHRSQKLYLDYAVRFSEEKQKQKDELSETLIKYKKCWEEKIYQAQKAGISIDTPVPHPDQIIIHSTGKVTIQGPTTRQEVSLIAEFQSKLEELEAISAEMRKYSKKDRKKLAYKNLLAKFVAVAKEAFECDQTLKEIFEIQIFASQDS